METINSNTATQMLYQKKISAFTINDAKKIFGYKKNNTLYKFLQRLERKNIIKRVKQGRYLFSLKEISDFELANFMHTPSYISLESALSFYGILSQFPYTITSITPNKSKKIIYQNREFEFNHIDTKYYFGIVKKNNFLIASPEKAFLDELYFISKGLRNIHLDDLDISKINKKLLKIMAQKYNFIPLEKILDKVLG